jgi:hypothetical protein
MAKEKIVVKPVLEDALLNPAFSSESLKMLIAYDAAKKKKAEQLAFNVGMMNIQTLLKAAPEDRTNEQTHSTYASYKTLMSYVKPFYTAEGFALIFHEDESIKEDNIRICVDVLHEAGHKESYWTDIPLDNRGIKGTVNKTGAHAKGSSISYGRSYLVKMIFNLSTSDKDDDDGNGAGGSIAGDNDTPKSNSSKANDVQIKRIKDLRDDLDFKEEDFKARLIKRFNTDCPRNLTHSEAGELIRALNVIKMRG